MSNTVNGISFHQKVPVDCPPLETKATHGLVAPEEFQLPTLNELWNSDAYFAFDIAVVCINHDNSI